MVIKKSDRNDIQELIRMTLDSPVTKKSQVTKVDGIRDISSYKGVNTDVKTRMILKITLDAMNGDRQAADWLMKYGGLEPVKESKVTVDTPTFIDDIGDGPSTETPELPKEKEKLNVYVDPVEAGLVEYE